jgi:hypothetical protein
MSPKTINITYWVSTLLFAALMIFSSIGGIQPSKDAIELMHDGLGYPVYFIQFISIAKLLGAVVILVPAAKKIKEWAYAACSSTLREQCTRALLHQESLTR